MRPFVATLAFLLGLPPSASSQWVQTNGPYGGFLGGFVHTLTVSGRTLYAGADYGGVFRSTDLGVHWTRVGLSNPELIALASSSISIFGSITSAGGMFDGGVYRSTTGGGSWVKVSPPFSPRYDFRSLAAVDSLVFTSAGGIFFHSTDNGASWKEGALGPINTPVVGVLQCGKTLFAATSRGVYRTTDNGNSWDSARSGLENAHVSALVGDVNDLFAGTYNAGVFRSIDSGATWRAAGTGLSNMGVGALALGGDELFACTAEGIIRSTDRGTSWKKVSAGLSQPYVYALGALDTTVFLGTDGGGVFRWDEHRLSWDPIGPLGADVNAMVRLGSDLLAGTYGGGVFRLKENTGTWCGANTGLATSRGSRTFIIYSLAVKERTLFAGTDCGVFRSLDSGATWTDVSSGIENAQVYALAVSGKTVLAAPGGGGILRSDDDGVTWSKVNTTFHSSVDRLFAIDDTTVICMISEAEVYRSNDNGLTWAAVKTGLLASAPRLALCGNDLYAGTKYSGVFRSTDNGITWTQAGLENRTVSALALSGSNLFAAVFSQSPDTSGIFLSTDKGASWGSVTAGLRDLLPGRPVEFLATAGRDLVAAVPEGGVWKRPLPEMITSLPTDANSPAPFQLQQNYPNPFNPTTTIGYSLPHRSHVTLTVYNTLGQKVAELVNGDIVAGYHEVQFNASNLASGVYFYRLHAGGSVAVRKCLIMK